MGNSQELIKGTKKMLKKHFDMKDMVKTHLDVNVYLEKNRVEPVSQLEYSKIIGSLMYITNCTRPDVPCAVNKLSQFTRYCDANRIGYNKDSKSTSGYVFSIGGGAVSCRSSKQTCIARSTMKSEFIALDKAAEEAEWLHNFLEDIRVGQA
ncbi:secreted RxLR effector protein 161-like [Primulina tabacum]|uniref:secreted RxLR effector protein 161-like n=1 Tax=Primulina tabacum TaxID=48773 RepID=UPI003F595461